MKDVKSGQYNSVQVLRGVAAMLVVLHHAGTLVSERGLGNISQFDWGAVGVDLFFAISGFVMVITTNRIWGQAGQWRVFIKKRLVRVVPLYWVATVVKIAMTLALPALALHSHLTIWHTVASLLFIPATNPNTDTVFPILTQGWTLSFEMLFYCIFAAAIWSGRKPVKIVSGTLIVLSLLALAKTKNWMPLGALTDPLLVEFIFGMLIGLATLNRKFLPNRVALILLFGAIVAFVLFGNYAQSYDGLPRFVFWGVPAAAVVYACLSMDWLFSGTHARSFRRLGDASYSIYLFHTFTLPVVGIAWNHFRWVGIVSAFAAVAICMVFSIVAGLAIHRYIETPLTNLPAVRGVGRRGVA